MGPTRTPEQVGQQTPGDALGEGLRVLGLVLAAGRGRRYGGPKALVDGWLADRVGALSDGGCAPVLVTIGASAERVLPLVPAEARAVVVERWREGMAASLRAGLRAALGTDADAVLVALVDTPGLTGAAVARVIAAGGSAGRGALAQARYDGRPGHPVLLGRDHWAGVAASAQGDRGARAYLASAAVTLVECGDVGDGRDVDVPEG